MRHRIKGKKLSRKRGHRQSLIKNLSVSLILYEKIVTTEAKGKLVKGMVDEILTLGKNNDLSARRSILGQLNSKLATRKIFEDLNQQFKDRKFGFSRVVKINNRRGDNAPQVLVELLIKHKEKKIERKDGKPEIKKTKENQDLSEKRKERIGFWERVKGGAKKIRSSRIASKKTIERTTSK